MIWIDGFPIDVALTEDYTLDSEVTRNPVERGAATTDHIRELPDSITIEGVVSDHPMGAVAEHRDGVHKPSATAYERLKAIRKRAEPITIITSLGTHADMVLEKLGVPVRVEGGEALRFRATFTKFEIVENERTFVKVAEARAAKRTNRGNKPAKKPPDKPANEESSKKASILYKLIH